MKKTVSLLLVLLLLSAAAALGLSACGDDSGKNNQTTPAASQETATTQAVNADTKDNTDQAASASDAFTFTFKGTAIAMKADAEPILAELGECKSYNEETSCAFDGLDKTYTYTSFLLTTYPDGDKDRINSVTLRDDTVSTADGICIGDSKDKVEAAYGADAYNGVNAYIINSDNGDAQLTVILDSDKVSSIQYSAQFE